MSAQRLSSPVAVGLLGPDGPWVGFAHGADGYRLAVSGPDGAAVLSPASDGQRVGELLGVAAAYFEETLASPPSELEATQADLAELVRWLADGEADPVRRRWLEEAVDAIDDGLAGEVVAGRLVRAAAPDARTDDEPVDLLDLLVSRSRALAEPDPRMPRR